MQQFDLTIDEFRELTKKIGDADTFANNYKEYILDYPFKDAYIVYVKEGYVKVEYYLDIGHGVSFDRIYKISTEELKDVLDECDRTFEKVREIKRNMNN